MRFRIALLSSLALALFGSLSLAQEARPERREMRKKILQRFDRDGDGRLSADERAELRSFLQKWRGKGGEGKREKGPGISGLGKMPDSPPEKLSGLYGWPPPNVSVTQKNLELEDTKRGKTLAFRATYPDNTKAGLPVIVWSHGLYGSQDSYDPLVKFWARHGYLVLQPSHSDSLRRGSGLDNPTSDWANRPKDISFLLDSLNSHPLLGPKANLSRVGMGGHSYGAHTTMLVGGAKTVVGGPFADLRPRCFVAISPQGEDRLFDRSSWSGLKHPTLFVSGDNDSGRKGDPADWRLAPYRGAPAGEKYLLWVKDAYHNFGGISGLRHSKSGPADGDQLTLVKSSTLAFWDKYLKNDPSATKLVNSGDFNQLSQGLAKWSER